MTVQTTEAWVPSLDDFAARIAAVRHHMKWNYTQAGKETGIDGENWRLWERGRKCSDKEAAARSIAAASGVDFIWLLTGQDVRGPGRGPQGQGSDSISWWLTGSEVVGADLALTA